ncbi:MAG: hypothetical protein JNL98_24250 [Bryobacterales bacterium]|nr:hypothetical protein [Bryobacterales bacterium]
MTHLDEDQLILHYYGEMPPSASQSHLDTCEQCRGRYRDLQRVLNVVDGYPVPELDASYESRVWRKLQPRLDGRPSWFPGWRLLPGRALVAAAGLAVLVVASFFAGRLSTNPETARYAGRPDPQRARVLLTAVGDHLEQSQFLLTGIAEADGAVPYHSETVRDLVQANRLYRQSAAQVGERAVEELLDDLERLLLEVEHAGRGAGAEELRRGMAASGLLLRMRAISGELRQRQRQLAGGEGESL